MRTAKQKKEACEHAREILEKWLPAGATVYTIRLRSRDTAAGRVYYSCLFVQVNGRIENITGLAARLTDWRTSRNTARHEVLTRSEGPCKVVEHLSWELYGAGGKLNAIEL